MVLLPVPLIVLYLQWLRNVCSFSDPQTLISIYYFLNTAALVAVASLQGNNFKW